ncbi:MAG TPA: type IV secretory system conjugative DNA transfer family protein, partial [Actinomycetota bacterium]|nr:type IV secretory system conjugative DNA transfer family protein [Actinomycetota bacterium]
MGMEREGVGGFELLVIIVAGIALALVGAVWAGAWLALAASGGGHLPFAAAADAAPRLPAHMSAPAEAWPEPYAEALPGAPVYWLCTAVAAIAIGGA